MHITISYSDIPIFRYSDIPLPIPPQFSWNTGGSKKGGVGHISPRVFRRRLGRYWHPLGCQAIALRKPPQWGVIYRTLYTVYQYRASSKVHILYQYNSIQGTVSSSDVGQVRAALAPDERDFLSLTSRKIDTPYEIVATLHRPRLKKKKNHRPPLQKKETKPRTTNVHKLTTIITILLS